MIKLALLGAGAWFLNKKVKENRAAGRSAFDFGFNRSSTGGPTGGSSQGQSGMGSVNPMPA